MKLSLFFFFIIVLQTCFAQETVARLGQYYSFCNSISDLTHSEQKLDSIYKNGNKWVIQATVRDKCIVRLYPSHSIVKDTLKIEMLEITEYQIELENGDGFVEVQNEYDCFCLYEVRMEFYLEDIKHLTINGEFQKTNAFIN